MSATSPKGPRNNSTDYDQDLQKLVQESKSSDEILEKLMLEDLTQTVDLFLPIYKKLHRADGYASIEVNPLLAQDSGGMITEGKRFFRSRCERLSVIKNSSWVIIINGLVVVAAIVNRVRFISRSNCFTI
jgi:hypothetical protein